MKDAIEMGSGAMIYIPSFIKSGSTIQKLFRVHTHSKIISYAYHFFK
jgi:hypothetical protein